MMPDLGVFISGVAAVAFAAFMVTQRSLYLCALGLLLVVTQAAALFFFSGAPLLAFLQIMIYAGAVMVLIVIAIMAAAPGEAGSWADLSVPKPLAVVAALALAAEVVLALSRGGSGRLPWTAPAVDPAKVGVLLFGPYSAATEAVTFLILLSALAVVGRREARR